LLGHEAIKLIRTEFITEKRPHILVFNLTGNILEADKLLFLEVGSSGILAKPTKLEDFMNLIKKNLGLYISQGLLQLDEDRIVMDDGEFQIGVRHLRVSAEPVAEPLTTDRGKLTGNWAGGAIQRTAGS
jgi:DNA-binding response OmpR family regulator